MSPFIPAWVLMIPPFLQAFANKWIPSEFRPVSVLALAGLLVAFFTATTGLTLPEFPAQLSAVYLVLAGGWALGMPVVGTARAIKGSALGALSLIGVALAVYYILGPWGHGAMAQVAAPDGPAPITPGEGVEQSARLWLAVLFSWLGGLIARKLDRSKKAVGYAS